MTAHPYVILAQQSVQHYLNHQEKLPCPNPLSEEMKERSGAFVCIKKSDQLRGCIGTLEPTEDNLALEIIENSVKAALHDPRFSPVTGEELVDLDYSIDVIGPMEKVANRSELDPFIYGVVVRSEKKQGVLLPNLEGVDSAEKQIAICREKGQIGPDDSVEFFRFSVHRFK